MLTGLFVALLGRRRKAWQSRFMDGKVLIEKRGDGFCFVYQNLPYVYYRVYYEIWLSYSACEVSKRSRLFESYMHIFLMLDKIELLTIISMRTHKFECIMNRNHSLISIRFNYQDFELFPEQNRIWSAEHG